MLLTLVLSDDALGVCTADLNLDGLADDDVFELNLAGLLSQDRSLGCIPLDQRVTLLDRVAAADQDGSAVRHWVVLKFAALRIVDADDAVLLEGHERLGSVLEGGFNFVALNHLNDARGLRLVHGVGDGADCDTAGMEGTHGELRTWFTDGLRRDDADGHSLLNRLTGGEVHAVAATADAACGLARERTANMHGVDAKIFDLAGNDVRDDLVLANNFATSTQIDDRLQGSAAADLVLQRNIHFFALVQGALRNAGLRAAIRLDDGDRLRHVAKLAREVAGVSGLECGIGQSLTGAVR